MTTYQHILIILDNLEIVSIWALFGPETAVVQCSAVQWSALQCITVQCIAVQCSAVQCSSLLCSAVQCSASLLHGQNSGRSLLSWEILPQPHLLHHQPLFYRNTAILSNYYLNSLEMATTNKKILFWNNTSQIISFLKSAFGRNTFKPYTLWQTIYMKPI